MSNDALELLQGIEWMGDIAKENKETAAARIAILAEAFAAKAADLYERLSGMKDA